MNEVAECAREPLEWCLTSQQQGTDDFELSVVIPTFNSAIWLPSTFAALSRALQQTPWTVEIVVVDDGSTDNTSEVLEKVALTLPYPVNVVKQSNQGRFMARWNGIQAATHEDTLIIDSRMLVHEQTFAYVEAARQRGAIPSVWNGHVITDQAAPLVGRFWEVPTFLFWGKYLSRPKPTLITAANFDSVPKGTSFLLIKKELFERACLAIWPTENAHLTSDDTKLLRHVVGETPILLDPSFSATYRPRSTVRKFLAHSWVRGTLFVDSYAGTSPLRNAVLLALVATPPVALVALGFGILTGSRAISLSLVGTALGALLAPFAVAAGRGSPAKANLSYLTFVLPFGGAFWAGLTRGVVVHRNNFRRTARVNAETQVKP